MCCARDRIWEEARPGRCGACGDSEVLYARGMAQTGRQPGRLTGDSSYPFVGIPRDCVCLLLKAPLTQRVVALETGLHSLSKHSSLVISIIKNSMKEVTTRTFHYLILKMFATQ